MPRMVMQLSGTVDKMQSMIIIYKVPLSQLCVQLNSNLQRLSLLKTTKCKIQWHESIKNGVIVYIIIFLDWANSS